MNVLSWLCWCQYGMVSVVKCGMCVFVVNEQTLSCVRDEYSRLRVYSLHYFFSFVLKPHGSRQFFADAPYSWWNQHNSCVAVALSRDCVLFERLRLWYGVESRREMCSLLSMLSIRCVNFSNADASSSIFDSNGFSVLIAFTLKRSETSHIESVIFARSSAVKSFVQWNRRLSELF